MYTVAIYSRKSKLSEKGESIQNQIDLCKDYANRYFNVSHFIIYEDEGYSGGNINRPKFKLLIEDAKRKIFNVLVCYRLDRISRNISDFSNTMELLNEHNISFISVKEQFDTSTPMGRAMMYIASVFAQLERETIAERIKDNMLSLARSGRWLGGQTPTGFKSEAITYYDQDMNKKKMYKLSPIKIELDLVKELYFKFLELKSLTKLENWTIKNHIKTKNNNNFDKSSIKLILTNPVYAVADELLYDYFNKNNCDVASPKSDFDGIHAVITYNKNDRINKNDWIIAIGKHQGIILSKNWIKVQNLLKENSIKAPRLHTGSIGLITPFLICKNCGSKMRISTYKRNNGTYYYYRCLIKERSCRVKCDVDNLSGAIADELILDKIKNIPIRQNILYDKLLYNLKNINILSNENKKHTLEKELKTFENAITNLTIQLSQNQNSNAAKYIVSQIEEFDEKINTLRRELESISQYSKFTSSEEDSINSCIKLLNNFHSNVYNLSFEEKKLFLRSFIKNITWDGKKLEVCLKYSFAI